MICRDMCLTYIADTVADEHAAQQTVGTGQDAEEAAAVAAADGVAGLPRLELLCASCRLYRNVPGYEGMRMTYFDDPLTATGVTDPLTGICATHKEACMESLCTDCIISSNAPTTYATTPACVASAPICDDYMYNYTQQICTARYDICPPAFIGTGTCDAGCNNERCGYDSGDCCSVRAPECSATMVGDGACDDVCNNAYCQARLFSLYTCSLRACA